jgi:hypothetical protein
MLDVVCILSLSRSALKRVTQQAVPTSLHGALHLLAPLICFRSNPAVLLRCFLI